MTRHRTILLAIILVAFFLRMWQLPQTPPGLWYDEAYNGMDALWLAETGQYPAFFVGNNGREPMLHYLLFLSTSLLGNSSFAVRLVGALAGFITVPIMYRFALLFLRPYARNKHQCRWLALITAGWLAVSWWHLLNSRAGFRPVLLPPLLMLSLYFWLKGVKNRHAFNFVLSGLFLGLLQYTYLPARLAPLIFAGFVLLWTVQALKRGGMFRLWGGLFITAIVAAFVFMPLALFFLNNPDSFSSRTGDVIFIPDSISKTATHLMQAVGLFFGAGHNLYRHHLPGRAMLGWLEIPFFWLGLVTLFRPASMRRAETGLILLGVVVMWLPALLASPPIHSLRPIGLLPFYYLIVSLGLYSLSRFNFGSDKIFPFLAATVITLNGFVNSYDYFQRWANHPEVYKEENGALVDLTRRIISLTETRDVIIPFYLYAHPTTRYLLWNSFSETDSPPPTASKRPAEMLIVPSSFQLLYVGNIPESPALVLLSRDDGGVAYVSRPPRAGEQAEINGLLQQQQPVNFKDRLGRTVAQFVSLPDYLPLKNLFDTTPLQKTNLTWANTARLEGYDVTPELVVAGQPITINLYWHSLSDKPFEQRLFIQLIDSVGNPITQLEADAFREDMYRWRPDGILTTQHTLWTSPDATPGAYLVRLGFFDDISGKRLPIGQNGIDQVQFGLFYIVADGLDPRQPAVSLSAATFGEYIKLIGITLPQPDIQAVTSNFEVIFHWQALQPTPIPYTVFLQLINEQGAVISSWDSQPLHGLYPTNRWSAGEIIADKFLLPLPDGGLTIGRYRLVAGLYDFNRFQRLPVSSGGDFVQLAEFVVE